MDFSTFNFQEWLIIGLIGLLFAKDYLFAFISKKFNIKTPSGLNGLDKKITNTPDWARELIYHFNHETSEQHRETNELLRRMVTKIEEHHTLEQRSLTLLENMDKYGVPCRDKLII